MQKPVKIYTLSTCSHCKATKKLLDDCRVKYEFTDVNLLDQEERTAILADVKKIESTLLLSYHCHWRQDPHRISRR